MASEPIRRVARMDKHELADMPTAWSNRERGQYLRLLLRLKGIDPNRLYAVDYYPCRACWILVQNGEPKAEEPHSIAPQTAEAFYLQAVSELRRTARMAFAAAAARSQHFATFGCPYELPHQPQEITPADLRELVAGAGADNPSVRFTGEGGWESGPSSN
jgi:hypothetical protein